MLSSYATPSLVNDQFSGVNAVRYLSYFPTRAACSAHIAFYKFCLNTFE